MRKAGKALCILRINFSTILGMLRDTIMEGKLQI